MPNGDIQILLGEIKGKLDMVINTQSLHTTQLEHYGKRINSAESKAAQQGMVTGAIGAVGIAFIKEKLGL